MRRRFDHIDLRVSSLAEAGPFYQTLLPALGFTHSMKINEWLQYDASESEVTEFFGITESASHTPNENRIAFWAETNEEVDRLADVVRAAGGRNIEGPLYEDAGYYAVFFEDPCGNRLEVCHRKAGGSPAI